MKRSNVRPLTPRQRAFIKEWIRNGGNGTHAALATYGCTTPNSASVCAHRILRNAYLQRAIEAEITGNDLTLEALARALSHALDAVKVNPKTGEVVPGHRIRLKAAEMVFRLLGVGE